MVLVVTSVAKITEKEKAEFDKLYNYVKAILGYNDDMALPKYMVMRLKGLSEGKFYANNKVKQTAQYSYRIILLTFMYCKDKINKALATKKFTNEQNKFNYIMAIVQNNINDVVIRLKDAEKSKAMAKKQIDKIEIDTIPIKQSNTDNQISITDANKNLKSKFNDLTKEMW